MRILSLASKRSTSTICGRLVVRVLIPAAPPHMAWHGGMLLTSYVTSQTSDSLPLALALLLRPRVLSSVQGPGSSTHRPKTEGLRYLVADTTLRDGLITLGASQKCTGHQELA